MKKCKKCLNTYNYNGTEFCSSICETLFYDEMSHNKVMREAASEQTFYSIQILERLQAIEELSNNSSDSSKKQKRLENDDQSEILQELLMETKKMRVLFSEMLRINESLKKNNENQEHLLRYCYSCYSKTYRYKRNCDICNSEFPDFDDEIVRFRQENLIMKRLRLSFKEANLKRRGFTRLKGKLDLEKAMDLEALKSLDVFTEDNWEEYSQEIVDLWFSSNEGSFYYKELRDEFYNWMDTKWYTYKTLSGQIKGINKFCNSLIKKYSEIIKKRNY